MRINFEDAERMFSSIPMYGGKRQDKTFQYHSAYNIVKSTYPEYDQEIIDEICDIIYWFGYLKVQYGSDKSLENRIIGEGMKKVDMDKRWETFKKNKAAKLLKDAEFLKQQLLELENKRQELQSRLRELSCE